MLSGEFCTFFRNEALCLLGETNESQMAFKASRWYDQR
jgi:hypothetical protein